MQVVLKITATVERQKGKFAPRDEIIEEMINQVDGANPYLITGVGADGDSEYEITDWEVEQA